MVVDLHKSKNGKYTQIVKPLFEEGWWNVLEEFIDSSKFDKIINFLKKQKEEGKIVVPRDVDCFRAFKECPYKDLKIIIISQDPYPGTYNNKPEADGLAFSYRPTNDEDNHIPKSLGIILREVERDIYKNESDNTNLYDTNLTRWANQGVLLLNTALTTELSIIAAHTQIWREFMYNIINIINFANPGTIFMLWGEEAKGLKPLIYKTHHILEACHPAAQFYSHGKITFSGCSHFSQANKILEDNNGRDAKIIW